MADDIRIARWDLVATAGTTQRLIFTAPESLTSLAVYTGGTITDVDDLTDATAAAATLSTTTEANDTATVDVVVPTGSSTPLRLVVDGAVVAVGRLTPSTSGTSSTDNTITLVADTRTYALTVGGIVVVSGGEGGGAVDSVNGQTGVVVLDADDVGAQPVDSDLTAIAALTTTAFGRGLLALADAAAGRTALGVYSSAETDAVAASAAAALVDSAPGTLDTLNELAAALGDDPNFATTITTALADKQPLDSDLTAIAALTTTAYGRSLLEAADAAALRTLAGVYSTGEVDTAISNATSDLAADADVVHDTGDETIAGVKTFTSSPIVPTPTTDFQAATKKYVDDNAGAGGATLERDTRLVLSGGSFAGVGIPGIGFVGMGGKKDPFDANSVCYFPAFAERALTITALHAFIESAASGGATAQFAVYAADDEWQPGARLGLASAIAIDSTGLKSVTGLTIAVPAGRFLLAGRPSTGLGTWRTWCGSVGHLIGGWIPATLEPGTYHKIQAVSGTLADPGPAFADIGSVTTISTAGTYEYPIMATWEYDA